jgi:ADP-ribosyl-[dinitrogen reductase] hydrolase
MKGSCLCGAVSYVVDRPDTPISHCPCKACRKAAPLFSSTLGVNREQFHWLSGEDKLTLFESSRGKQRYFCSVCGSHLLAKRIAQANAAVRVATNDNPNYIPAMPVWRSPDVAWLHDDQDAVSYSGRPSGR